MDISRTKTASQIKTDTKHKNAIAQIFAAILAVPNLSKNLRQKLAWMLLVSCMLHFSVLGQTKSTLDTLIKTQGLQPPELFPRARLAEFRYGTSLSRQFSSELFKEDISEGTIASQHYFSASVTLPLLQTGVLQVRGTMNYDFNRFEFENIDNDAPLVFERNGSVNYQYFSASINTLYFSKLFKRQMVYISTIILDADENAIQRLRGIFGFSLNIKKNDRTQISAGAIVFVDPASPIPALPSFNLEHLFQDNKSSVDIVFPRQVLIRRLIGKRSRISLGTVFNPSIFYVGDYNSNLSGTFEFNQLELKSGLIYQHRLSKLVLISASGGLSNIINSRLAEKGEPNSEFIYKTEQNATGYFQITVSLIPFWAN
ncbi:MAG: hypothetical protein AAF090_06890 [Bacteroidota bacterium]